MLRLSRSSLCPFTRHAWKRGLEELPVNRVEDEGQHDGTPLINRTSIGRLLFQDVFVGTPKWFRAASELHAFGHLAGDARLRRVACSCRPGQEPTRYCNYGRLCGSLLIGGRDSRARSLISEGLAHWFVCGERGCPKRRPSSWAAAR